MKNIGTHIFAASLALSTIGIGKCILVPAGGTLGQAPSAVLVPASGSSNGMVFQQAVVQPTLNVVPAVVQPAATAVVLQQPVAVVPASQVVVVPAAQPAAVPANQAAAPVQARNAEADTETLDSESLDKD